MLSAVSASCAELVNHLYSPGAKQHVVFKPISGSFFFQSEVSSLYFSPENRVVFRGVSSA
jgi:hypothetical protein